jgi:hypothetical protein
MRIRETKKEGGSRNAEGGKKEVEKVRRWEGGKKEVERLRS